MQTEHESLEREDHDSMEPPTSSFGAATEQIPTSGRYVRKQSGRAAYANHLLNFRTSMATGTRGGRTPANFRSSVKGMAPRPPVYDRAKFLQANFRFLISDACADIAQYEADPDLMLDWDDVALVVVLTTAPLKCPITLGTPLCPCITPCGHIFSLEAILAHMVTQGGLELRASSPCPLCAAAVVARELRPVAIRSVDIVRPGDRVNFQLLKRCTNKINPVAVKESDDMMDNSLATVPLTSSVYAKFALLSNPSRIWEMEARLLGRKATQVLSEGGPDAEYEGPAILAAIEAVASRARSWTERRHRAWQERLGEDEYNARFRGSCPEDAGRAASANVKKAAEAASRLEEEAKTKAIAMSALEREFPSLGVTSSSSSRAADPVNEAGILEIAQAALCSISEKIGHNASSRDRAPQSQDLYYYYQASDGQWLFLCPLNMRMLAEWTGSYEALPPQISATTLEVEELIQTDAVRKRWKMLSHLPSGSSFRLCELDLTSILPPDVVARFDGELTQRAKKRALTAKRDAQRRQREEAAALMTVEDRQVGPSAAELAAMPRLHGVRATSEPMDVPGAAFTDSVAVDYNDTNQFPTPQSSSETSFAHITRMGFAATGPALGNGSPQAQGHSPTGRPAWGFRSSGQKPSTGSQKVADSATPGEMEVGTVVKKGKQKKLVLLSSSQRRY